MSDVVGIRPAVPDRWRRFLLRSGFAPPNPSELRWLVFDLAEPGGARRHMVASWWLIPVAAYWVASGLHTFGATWTLALVLSGAVAMASIATALIRKPPLERIKRNRFGLGPDDPCTVELVDVNRFRRFSRTNRLTGGLIVLAVAINGVLMLAQPPQRDLVVENVTCSEGDDIVLTADVRNTTERVTFGTSLTGTVRVDSGDHFDGSTSIQLEPGDAVEVELATGLSGRVTECEAHVPNSVTRVETNP